MFEVLTIGSSLIDVFIDSDEFELKKTKEGVVLCQPFGDKMEVDGFTLETGGGGGNTAVGFARLGFKTGVVSELGKDVLADLIVKDFHKEFVMTNCIIKERKEQTGGSVMLVGPTGDRTVMVHRGAASMLDPHDLPVDQIKRTGWIHLSSISGRQATLEQLFKILSQVEGGRKLSWNPGKKELLLLNQNRLSIDQLPVEILIVNKLEWQMIDALTSTLRSHIPLIVVTDGHKGGHVFMRRGGEFDFASSGTQAKESTGAGDSFSVGLVAGHIWDFEPKKAVKLGVMNAGSVVSLVGAKQGLLTKSAILSRAGIS
ncbi:MAG: PfkB family carbohydrate kinase [Patescibacteria group bacterium]|nr:hypothetical protein [Patescibacteria group bacterium]